MSRLSIATDVAPTKATLSAVAWLLVLATKDAHHTGRYAHPKGGARDARRFQSSRAANKVGNDQSSPRRRAPKTSHAIWALSKKSNSPQGESV
jgi:hypothetical protein